MIYALVADDEEAICELVAAVLSDIGMTVLCARDGTEALALARHHLPHVIISDVGMPRMTGIDLVRALRADATTQHIPVILYSAAKLADAAIMHDIVTFLPKPFDIGHLEKVVMHAVHGLPPSALPPSC